MVCSFFLKDRAGPAARQTLSLASSAPAAAWHLGTNVLGFARLSRENQKKNN
jgi:hypothetical protein